MTYKESLNFLDSLIDYEKITTYSYDVMKLDRMRTLLDALGNPQDSFQSIHIAGSRGKGSTCAMVYSILREAGFSVGLYTSPHLISRNERIRFAKGDEDRVITDDELAELIAQIEPVVKELSQPLTGFTFFEVFTALSFLFFKERKVDIAVLEVGMGGRLDATNVVQPLIAAVTPISYDHTDKLGTTLTEIAREKAEILKKGSVGVVSHQEREPLEEIRRVAEEKRLSLVEVTPLYSCQIFEKGKEGTYFDVKGPHGDFHSLSLPLLGEHQVRNALTAIAICEALSQKGHGISKAEIHRGLSKVDWPGRFQIVAQEPTVIVDGAQNGASAKALKETFLDLFGSRPLCLILGISANKEIEAVCKILCPLAESVIVTQAQSSRALRVEALLQYASSYAKHLQVVPSLGEALFWARTRFNPKGAILVTGSLYLVGEALALLENEENERMGRERMSESKTHSPTLPFSHPQT